MKNKNIPVLAIFWLLAIVWNGCGTSRGEDPGHEFMPDMFHSIAFEANVYDYYYYNTWGTEDEYKKYAMPRKPVKGTIPRGYTGLSMTEHPAEDQVYYQSMPINGFVPYYYIDNEEERMRASAEITSNPYPITTTGLTEGKQLYEVYCGICHGENADGLGYLVRDDGGVYPAQPANFLLPEFVAASEGRYYHAIIYGKNVMGGYADKLSYQERWEVIHYIRSLQAKEAGLQYSETSNTFNTNTTGMMAIAAQGNPEPAVMEEAHDGQDTEDEPHH